MSEPEKRKAFCTEERWTFCPQEMPVRKHVALAATLGIALSTLNTLVIKRTDTECVIHYVADCLVRGRA